MDDPPTTPPETPPETPPSTPPPADPPAFDLAAWATAQEERTAAAFTGVTELLGELREALTSAPGTAPVVPPGTPPPPPVERKDPRNRVQRGWFGKLRL